MERVVHIQHRVHVSDPNKKRHFATLRTVFLAEGNDKLVKNEMLKWQTVDSFDTAVPSVLAGQLGKSLGPCERG